MKHMIRSVVLCLSMLSATVANAALVPAMVGQIVNDTTSNISWLANVNLAATNTFGVSGINANGLMSWYTAQNWITAMNTADYLGFNNWRLPSTVSCYNFNCGTSEMGNLFYNELGGVAGQPISGTHNASYGLFNNFPSANQSPPIYWSGTTDTGFSAGDVALWFAFNNGIQESHAKNNIDYVMAVRDGQVSGVPEPGEWALMASGLGILGYIVRRRKVA